MKNEYKTINQYAIAQLQLYRHYYQKYTFNGNIFIKDNPMALRSYIPVPYMF